MKIFGTKLTEVDLYPLDFFSISHFVSGIIAYYISFFLFVEIFKMIPLSAILLSYVCAFVGGLIWEFFENIFIIDMKENKRQDSPINSLMDVVLVFLGSIVGCYTYELDWIFKILLISGLFIAFMISKILTVKNTNLSGTKSK